MVFGSDLTSKYTCFAHVTSPLTKIFGTLLCSITYGLGHLFHSLSQPKRSMQNLSSKQVLWHGGRPPSPAASAAMELKLCTLQPIAPTQSQTTLFRLSMSRHVWVLSRDGAKKCVTGVGVSSDFRQKEQQQISGGEMKNTLLCFIRGLLWLLAIM